MAIGSALTLIAIGAILAVALQLDPTPMAGITVDWTAVGYILMVVGVIGLIWSLVLLNSGRRRDPLGRTDTFVDGRRDTVVEDRQRRIYE
jgi:Domain of unknown function (DUF6458)